MTFASTVDFGFLQMWENIENCNYSENLNDRRMFLFPFVKMIEITFGFIYV